MVEGGCLLLLGLWRLRWFEGISAIDSFRWFLDRRWSWERRMRRLLPDMRGAN